MILQITDKNAAILSLDTPGTTKRSFKPVVSPLKMRVGHKDRFSKAGGAVTGDQRASVRTITLNFDTVATNDDDFRAALNQIAGFLAVENQPLFLEDTDTGQIRAKIVLDSLSNRTGPGLEHRIGSGSLVLKFVESYYEDLAATITSPSGGSIVNNASFPVDNDAFVRCFPIIRLQPFNQNGEFIIRNETTGAAFALASNSFVPGTTFIVDAQNGTIFLDNGVTQVEQSIALADGSGFIFLAPGVNDIKYESVFGDMTIEVEFRRRYAF